MKLMGKEHTKREAIYLFTILIIAIGFFLLNWAQEKSITEYQKAYGECMVAYTMAADGKLPLWEGKGIQPYNMTTT